MGILCRFSNYDENYDILGAVHLFKFIEGREQMPGKRTLQREKEKSLTDLEREDFIGVSFEILNCVMNNYNIKFELFSDGEVILKNGGNAQCIKKEIV